MWFEIKCEPLYKDAPKHIDTSLELFRSLPVSTQGIVSYIERNAYFAHSENILLTLVADTDPSKRRQAVDIIKKIRKMQSLVMILQGPSGFQS